MQTCGWNRSDKAEFFRRYLEAVFPLLEGERPAEALLARCRPFLQRYGAVQRLELSKSEGFPAGAGTFLRVEATGEDSPQRRRLRGFLLAILLERVRGQEKI
ncbi:MAG: hypothetical protein HYX74_08900 [Acidobacteria bacterium]|nr:hypothetical protein [Acidobacteriota bacterium]